MSHVIIGTAGHVDHGKSAIVKAITGMDPDRLKEEKQRGLTIDLGFAFWGDNFAFIDVPGHERFVKNMVAGVSTIDMVMLVVAADDGVMPQTREHFDILRLLEIKKGLIALSKIDLVDEEWLAMVQQDVQHLVVNSFLENAPIYKVSPVTGQGIDQLKKGLLQMAADLPPRPQRAEFWMPVDRSFTIQGHGTVVTGSVLSGEAKTGQELEILPGKRDVKIRHIQKHGHTASAARQGERAALNLASISKEEISRGDVLATSGRFEPSHLFDVSLSLLSSAPKTLLSNTRVRVHIGSSEIMGRVKLLNCRSCQPGQNCLAQIKLEKPAVAMSRQPFIIRRYSPPLTIGGGLILDINPSPHKRFDDQIIRRLESIRQNKPGEILAALFGEKGAQPISEKDIAKRSGLPLEVVKNTIRTMVNEKQVCQLNSGFIHSEAFGQLKQQLLKELDAFHKAFPLRPGIDKARVQSKLGCDDNVFQKVVEELQREKLVRDENHILQRSYHKVTIEGQDRETASQIIGILEEKPFQTPPVKIITEKLGQSPGEIKRILFAMKELGQIIQLEDDIFLLSKYVEKAKEMLLEYAKDHEHISVSEFRNLIGTSRKYALPLLVYFDKTGITEREQDVRVIKK